MDILLNIFKELLTNISDKSAGLKHNRKCSYCKIQIIGYLYWCLECYEYSLCNECFIKKNCNESHENGHKVLRIDEPSSQIFGKDFKSFEINIDMFEKEFQNETHQGIKCNICNIEPIKGLRFKCSECFDFNLCTLCKNKATHGHQITHSMITHGKTVSNEIDFSKVKLQNRLGDGAFGDVFKAVYENKTVACKIINTQKIKLRNITLDSSHYDEMLKSYKRELNAYNEIKGDNILRMIGQCSIRDKNTFKFVLLTELMGKGSLDKLICNEPELTNRKRFNGGRHCLGYGLYSQIRLYS